MSITFTWSITKLEVVPTLENKSNVVTNVEWFLEGKDTENNITASIAGVRGFGLSDNFTPYDQLTEAQVLDWCFAPETMSWTSADNVEHSNIKHLKQEAEEQVTGQIERQLVKKQSEPALPWV